MKSIKSRMKQCYIFLFAILLSDFGYGQEIYNKELNTRYEEFLKEKGKDTLVSDMIKRYKCSEDFSGTIRFYYKQKELMMIEHSYKQGRYESSILEYYYLKADNLALRTVLSEISYMNTYSYKDERKETVGAEKVVEYIEERTFVEKNAAMACYKRSYGGKVAEWDQKYFNSLKFEESPCQEISEEVMYKYRLLRKAEKKLINSFRDKPNCIFHMW